jgi:hypothetical protein
MLSPEPCNISIRKSSDQLLGDAELTLKQFHPSAMIILNHPTISFATKSFQDSQDLRNLKALSVCELYSILLSVSDRARDLEVWS